LGSLVYLLPGQGIRYAGCAELLYAEDAFFRGELDRAAVHLRPLVGHDVRAVLCRPVQDVDLSLAERTSIAQPALLAYTLCLVATLSQQGVRADRLVGHSLGELACAAVAGVFEPSVALGLAAARGQLMEQCPVGAMLAVELSAEAVAPWLQTSCELAAVNAHDLCVISGEPAPIDELHRALQARHIPAQRLPTRHAFHCRLMEHAAGAFERTVAAVERRPLQVSFTSNVTGTWISARDAQDPRYWARQIREPVRHADQLGCILSDEGALIIDLTPQPGFASLVKRHSAYASQPVLSVREPAKPYAVTARAVARVASEVQQRGDGFAAAMPTA
jgi:acyl transferase domain-containing protein